MKANLLSTYRYELFFLALLLQILYPFLSLLLIVHIDFVRFLSFTILVLASFNLALRRIPRFLIIGFGVMSTLGVWGEYFLGDPYLIHLVRNYATCFFYMILIYVLTRSFLLSKAINLKVVVGAMSGYLLIGYLGASTIEMMELHHPGSFIIDIKKPFNYTYLSFITMLTVGYGDAIPSSSAAKSLTVLIALLGQLYMAVGIASFVGKFMAK